MSLFRKSEVKAKRLKAYIYGPTGTGKTVTSLSFPKPAVIDTEKGTDHYGKFFEFELINTSDVDKIHEAIDELMENPGDFSTLVLDSMSDIYDSIVKKREDYMKKKSGNLRYELMPKDYQYIKRDVKLLIHKLLALDMNIVATARSKAVYAEGEFMKHIGNAAEGHKDVPYRFDVVLELYIDEDGKRYARVEKDRTNTLPHVFEFSFTEFAKYLDMAEMQRAPVVFRQTEALADSSGRTTEISFNGKALKTAGVQADTLATLQTLLVNEDTNKVKAKLREAFGVESLLDLNENEAQAFRGELQEK
jgi:DNA-binding ferritin-like protein (Dps family)